MIGLDTNVILRYLLQDDPNLAHVRRRSWAPKRSIPICLADRSTTDQIDQSVRVSPLTLSPLRTGRRRKRDFLMPRSLLGRLA
jgi:hypothetical protein